MVSFRIDIVANVGNATAGLKKVEGQLKRVQSVSHDMGVVLRRALVGIGFAVGIREIIRFGDAAINLRNRLRTVIDDEQVLVQVQNRLLASANQNRSAYEDTVNLFQRLTAATRTLGISQEELLEVTDSIGKAIAVSGANSIEASNALRQLTQGIGAGALRGDELRSVLEQLPTLADVIARKLNTTREQLRKFGEQGKITTQVIIEALKDARQEIVDQFAKTVPTIGQAFEVLSNRFIELAGNVNDSTGIFGNAAKGIIFLSDNLEEIVRVVGVAIAVLGAAGLTKAILSLRNPVNLLVASLTFAGTQLLDLVERTGRASKEFGIWSDTTDRLNNNLERTAQIIKGLSTKDLQKLGLIVNAEGELATAPNKATGGRSFKIGRSVTGQEPTKQQLEDIGRAAQGIVLGTTAIERFTRGALKNLSDGLNKAKEGLTGLADSAGGFIDRALAIKQVTDDLTAQEDITRALIDGNERLAASLEIQNQLRQQGIELNDTEEKALERRIQRLQGLQAEQQALENILGVQRAIFQEEVALQALSAKRPDLIDQINDRLEQLRLRSLEASTALGDGFERAFIKLRREAEDLAAVGESIVNVFADNLTDALVTFAETGQLSFKDLARSIVSDLTKVIARLLVVQALSAIFGPAAPQALGPANVPFPFPGRQHGGPVRAGQPYVVGEKRPELFVPGRSGTIVPTTAGQPPQVNLQVVNVDDPNAVPQAIAGGRADQAFLNMLSRNRNKIKQTLGI